MIVLAQHVVGRRHFSLCFLCQFGNFGASLQQWHIGNNFFRLGAHLFGRFGQSFCGVGRRFERVDVLLCVSQRAVRRNTHVWRRIFLDVCKRGVFGFQFGQIVGCFGQRFGGFSASCERSTPRSTGNGLLDTIQLRFRFEAALLQIGAVVNDASFHKAR